MNFFKVHIGLRTFKTGLAVMLIMIAYHFIDRPAFVPATAAVFALRDSWDDTISFAKIRLVSNAIGGALAVVFYLVREYSHNANWLTIVFVPVLVMAGIIIHDKINYNTGIVGGMAAFLMIALTIPLDATIVYVLLRVMDVFIGVLFAIAINRFAMPDEIEKVEEEVGKIEQDAKQVIRRLEHKNDD
ncbi:hypothetical protein G6R27_06025 [Fructobacillus sp. M1-10]|uniref:Aromatic acid exporter family member 1 n=1 Tax=Fructobacillus papyriferae TaxID=2713171 RepID=A0ABS5QQV9_9LACO|nr:hypothetical protein [Fructobacillus papyriferae]